MGSTSLFLREVINAVFVCLGSKKTFFTEKSSLLEVANELVR